MNTKTLQEEIERLHYFGTSTTDFGHYFWDINYEYSMVKSSLWFKDLPFNPENYPRYDKGEPQKKGDVRFYNEYGYTILAITGSPKDQRGGTKSVFFIKGTLTRPEMVSLVKSNKLAMEIINAMPFDCELKAAASQQPSEGERVDSFLEYVDRLKNGSFEGWSDEAQGGYLTALGSLVHYYKMVQPQSEGTANHSTLQSDEDRWSAEARERYIAELEDRIKQLENPSEGRMSLQWLLEQEKSNQTKRMDEWKDNQEMRQSIFLDHEANIDAINRTIRILKEYPQFEAQKLNEEAAKTCLDIIKGAAASQPAPKLSMQECKDIVARKYLYSSWSEVVECHWELFKPTDALKASFESLFDEAALLYASQQITALKDAHYWEMEKLNEGLAERISIAVGEAEKEWDEEKARLTRENELLTQANAYLNSQPVREWVSVEERLPEVDEKVLGTNGYDIFKCRLTLLNHWQTEHNGEKIITHWQELPSPPAL
jgi:hypothetical protein